MDYTRFLEINRDVWNEYLAKISKMKSEDSVYAKDENGIVSEKEILFPVILLITETKNCFIAELLGANRSFEGLKVKGHKEISFDNYIYQFPSTDTDSLFKVSQHNIFKNLCFSRTSDFENLKLRFPAINLFKSRLICKANNISKLISFGSESNFLLIKTSLLVNVQMNFIRAKHILLLTAIQKDVKASEYEQWLRGILHNEEIEIYGVHTVDAGKAEDFALASQFANTYLTQGLHETTIGDFLNLHPDIIKRSFNAQTFVYEQSLPWVEKSPDNNDTAIKPDLLVQRADGFYDIYDLKTARLDKSITKGERRRRRFVDYVQDGIAQLANYAEYFTYPKNCEYASEKHGIRVEQPNLVLVVGHIDNSIRTEIEEASRQVKNTNIIDYDSFLQLFLLSNGN